MGIFKRSRTSQTTGPAVAAGESDTERPPDWPSQSYPATPDQLKVINGIVETITTARGTGKLTPRQVAGISVLCERLVAENDALAAFVADLRQVTEETSRRYPIEPGWSVLTEEL